MRLIQFKSADGKRQVAIADGAQLRIIDGVDSTYRLALDAIAAGKPLADLAAARAGKTMADYEAIIAARRLLPPVDHPDPAHLFVTGTGLTHLGSAVARDKMNAKLKAGGELTDSMKIFRMGMEGGKPKPGTINVQPE